MSLTVQNLRAVGTGVEPASLLPGQIAFNVTDKVLYVGDGSSFKTDFDGAQVAGVPGNGWYAMPMDFDSLGEYYVVNPGYYGDVPTDQQVLAWSTALNHPIWITGAGGGGSQVYVITNAQVAAAPGATTSAKITAAIGVASPDEGNVAIVTGLPDEVYEGLYFFTTEWVKGAAYAYPSASEVIYDNTGRSLGATVQLAIDDLDDGLIATTAIANTANSTANSALSIASAALPRAGGTMTGNITFQDAGEGVVFSDASTVSAINNSVTTTSATTAASSTAVKTAYDLASAAIPRSSFTAGGELLVGTGAGTFSPLPAGAADYILASDGTGNLVWVTQSEGDVTTVSGTVPIVVDNTDPQNPVVSVDLATTATPGVVQIELTGNMTLVGGVINVPNGSTTVKGAVQLNNTLSSTSTTLALTAAQGKALQDQIDALTLSNSVTLAGGYNATTGLVDGATSQGIAAGFVDGSAPPAPAPGNSDYYLICTTAGSNPSTMENGDWLLSDGTQYVVLGVGSRPASASYTQAGIVQLADGAAVLAGTSDTTAITPQALQDNVIDSVTTANSTLIASATAVKTAYDAAVAAQTTATAALPKTGGTMTGNITFQDAGEGVIFSDLSSVIAISDSVSTASATTAASSNAAKTAYDAGVQGQTDAAAAQATANAAVPCSSFTALGQLLSGTGGSTYSALSVGTNGQFLSANSACGTGLEWCTLSLACVPCSAYTAVGTILAGNGAGTYCSLPVGTNCQILVADTDCASGVKWATCPGSSLFGFTNNTGNFSTGIGFQAGNSLAPTGFANVFVGYQAGCQMSGGDYNVAVGNNSLQGTGSSNVAIGSGAMGQTASTGSNNVAVGYQSADALTSGANNIAIGQGSLGASTTASDQVAVGHQAGCSNTVGAQSVYVGSNAGLLSNSVGSVFVGFCAGQANTTSGCTTYLGYVSGRNATGLSNTYVGGLTGCAASNTSACGTLLGFCAGSALTTGNGNTLLGFQSGRNVNTGANNVAIGTAAFQTATTAASNVAIGCGALAGLSTSAGNTALGHRAMLNASTAANNVAIGCNAGEQISTGSTNVFIGNTAGDAVTTGSSNTIIGDIAGSAALANNLILAAGTTVKFQANDSGAWSPDGTNFGTIGQFLASNGTVAAPSWCTLSLACIPCSSFTASGQLLAGTGTSTFTALGAGSNGQFLAVDNTCTGGLKWVTAAGANICGFTCALTPFNTALGSNAGAAFTGASLCNTAIGFGALRLEALGDFNTALGHAALCSQNGPNGNTAIGAEAGCAIAGGSCNTLIGWTAGNCISTGSNNVAVGVNTLGAISGAFNVALGTNALALGTASSNTMLGYNAGCLVNTAVCNTFVGANSGIAVTTGSCNTIVGSYAGTTTLANNVVLADGAGNIKLQINQSGALGVGTTPTYGTAGQILVSGGSGAAPTWTSSGTVSANYGSFVRTTTQTNAGGASGNAVSYDTTSSANNFSIVSGSRITAAVAGTYQILASLQVQKTDAGTDDVNFWLKKNGVNEPNSAYNLTLQGSGAAQLGYINWVVTLAAGEYVELWWYSADANARLLTDPAVAPYPAVPSSGFIIHPMGA
jgi:hypothetical protein